MRNPFRISDVGADGSLPGRESFIDSALKSLSSGRHLSLIGRKGMGKTAIARALLQRMSQMGYKGVIVNLAMTRCAADFAKELRTSLDFEASLPENDGKAIEGMLSHADSSEHPTIIVLDEFHHIANYPDMEAVASALSKFMRKGAGVRFVLIGSQSEAMKTLVYRPTGPFFRMTEEMGVGPVEMESLQRHAHKAFDDESRNIVSDVVPELHERFGGDMSVIQRALSLMFFWTYRYSTCTKDMIDDTVGYILEQSHPAYEALFHQLPPKQRMLLTAIASEGKVKEITGRAFITAHGLDSAAKVQAALSGLLEKDLVLSGDGVYEPADQLFALWIRQQKYI